MNCMHTIRLGGLKFRQGICMLLNDILMCLTKVFANIGMQVFIDMLQVKFCITCVPIPYMGNIWWGKIFGKLYR